jgi:hypothetical protein
MFHSFLLTPASIAEAHTLKAKEASPKASLFDSMLRNINLGAQRGFTRAYFFAARPLFARAFCLSICCRAMMR